MDKKSIIGILLIFVIMIGWQVLMKPSKEEIEATKHRQDSIAKVEQQRAIELQQQEAEQKAAMQVNDTLNQKELAQKKISELGDFGNNAIGTEEFTTLENNQVKITLSNKGGRIYSVELKDYKRFDSTALVLFDGDKTLFGLNFFAQNRSINTQDLFFNYTGNSKKVVVPGPEVPKGAEGKLKFNKNNPGGTESVSYRLQLAPGKFIEYIYTLGYNSYMVDFDIKMEGMNEYISRNQSYINFDFAYDMPRQERHVPRMGEDTYTYMTYKFFEGEQNNLTRSKSDSEDLTTKVKWIGFKQLFFSSVIIADESFPNALIKQTKYKYENNHDYLANFSADIAVPYRGTENENVGMQFYFGPNHYQTLKQYGIGIENQVYLGYAIVRPVNKYVIIPVFNWLRRFIDNFGIIILLLTIMIKVVLFPFTYKSYMSQAKMRVLKPEVDEINEKFGKDQSKAMEKQQATMALYKKAGVNPMGGCLPMLLQMPILFAMFSFFPSSVELRGESFLWAHDLSTYDSVLQLPFNIPIYGDHVSLFCLLMTVSSILYTRVNQQMTAASNQSMPGMQTMMYLMPIMFLFILNSYPSGLSWYYFLANLITVSQTFLIRRFVDEDKIHAQLQANKKKPAKKSNFQKRMEDMAKQKGVKPRKK